MPFKLSLETQWKGDLLPFTELRRFIHDEWVDNVKEDLGYFTRPSRPETKSGRPLRKQWHSKTAGIKSIDIVPIRELTSEVYNDKEVIYDGKRWNLMSILHNGSGPYCAKGLRGPNNDNKPIRMKFFSRGQWWYLPCVRGVNPHKIHRYNGHGTYSYRKEFTQLLYKSDRDLTRGIYRWLPKT
jgi:hypothetical protein